MRHSQNVFDNVSVYGDRRHHILVKSWAVYHYHYHYYYRIYTARSQASSSQRRWRIARCGVRSLKTHLYNHIFGYYSCSAEWLFFVRWVQIDLLSYLLITRMLSSGGEGRGIGITECMWNVQRRIAWRSSRCYYLKTQTLPLCVTDMSTSQYHFIAFKH